MVSSLLEELSARWSTVLPAPLSPRQLDQFSRYAELLVEWNERINLTAIADPEGIVTRHFLDSLSVLGGLTAYRGTPRSLIDVGSGAGFPGMVLAIVRPAWQVTLLEATRKKVDFLALVANELGLEQVTPVWGRAEEQGRNPSHREQYDVAVARAVAELPVLAEYCLPFVRVGGLWIAQKGPRVEDEVVKSRNALGQLGGKLREVREITVPGLEGESRTMVIVEKAKPTPTTFPRRPGTPTKRPL